MVRALILIFCVVAAPAFAENAVLSIAQDRYEAGQTVQFDGPVVSDLFMAGNSVIVASPVTGSAHLAGRRVAINAAVGAIFSPQATALSQAQPWAAMRRSPRMRYRLPR